MTLSGSRQIALGFALVLALAAAIVGAVALVGSMISANATSLAETEAGNARLRLAITRSRQMLDVSTTGGAQAFAADYLASPQESIASADLQSRLRTLALDRRVDLASLNTLTPRTNTDVSFVGVRMTFRAPLSAIQALVHAIESEQPLLFVERAAIRADTSFERTDWPGDAGPPLAAELDVYAPMRPRGLVIKTTPIRIETAPVPGSGSMGAPRP